MTAFSQVKADLPVLGVGASLSFGVEPDPVALAGAPGGPSFIEYAGAVQHDAMGDSVRKLHALDVPVLYHPSCLNLCGSIPNPPHWLAAVDAHVRAVDSAWLAQDVAICFGSEAPGYSIQLGYFVPPVLTAASLDIAVDRVNEVCAAVSRPLLLEPAPVTFQLGDMDVFHWLGQLAERTDCGILLDCGHVVSHQMALGREDVCEGIDALDMGRVVEIHIAGGVVEHKGERSYYIDAHDLPILPESWRVFHHLLERTPELRAVCFECEGAMGGAVLGVLDQVRERVALATCNDKLRERVDAELAGAKKR